MITLSRTFVSVTAKLERSLPKLSISWIISAANQPLQRTVSVNFQIIIADVEKFLVMRGIVAAKGDLMQSLKTQKDQEAFQFVTESSHLAGEAFQLNHAELQEVTNYI